MRRSLRTRFGVDGVPRIIAVMSVIGVCTAMSYAGPPPDLIFADGFESGTPCFWSAPDCLDSVFPVVTSAAQEPVRDDADADATMVYPSAAPVVINSGESRLGRVDLYVPGRGQTDFEFVRRYRSRLDYDGPLGFGWDFTYNERLLILGNGDVARSNGMGHVDVWTSLGGGQFTAPEGYFGTLTEETNGTNILRETDGFKRIYSEAGRLAQHEDRFGNTMQFDYDQTDHLTLVTDAYGREYD